MQATANSRYPGSATCSSPGQKARYSCASNRQDMGKWKEEASWAHIYMRLKDALDFGYRYAQRQLWFCVGRLGMVDRNISFQWFNTVQIRRNRRTQSLHHVSISMLSPTHLSIPGYDRASPRPCAPCPDFYAKLRKTYNDQVFITKLFQSDSESCS
ncbi:hypothetical protein BJ165DRAFT_1440915 [Panaeolus papilionaceus]|nr:hypothetical protein BJ165DRAFT_1440915 [Panaeolus papilionaceus]